MYQEYAIDPTTICRSFDRFKLFWNGLGYHEGRLLSRFPGTWERKVVKSPAYKDLPDGHRKKAIEESLIREAKAKRKSIASGRKYDPCAESWLTEVEQTQASQPFHGILAEENPNQHSDIICFDDVGDKEDCWCTPTPWQVKRCHTDLAQTAAPLLLASRELLFIEPYFRLSSRFTRPLKRMFESIKEYEQKIDRIEIHLKKGDPKDGFENFLDGFEHDLKNKVQECCTRPCDWVLDKLEFFIWESPDDDRMHPRYILTDTAGLGFENGLDEDRGGDTYTDVNLVTGPSLERRWNEFQVETATRKKVKTYKAADFI